MWFEMTAELSISSFTVNEYDEVDSVTVTDGTSTEVLP